MSLQTRLADLVAAVGADIKADRARLTTLETATNGPRCLLYKTAGQTIAASTFVPIVWEGEDEDLLGMHATNGTTVTVPEAGIYFASAFIGFSVGNVSGRFLTMIYVNGAESRGGFRHEITMPAIGTAAWHTGLPTGLFKLNAGDTLSVVVYQTTGGTLSVSSNSDNAKFSVFKVDVKGATGPQGPAGPAGAAPASYTLDTWHNVGGSGEPAFANSWVNYDNSAATPSATPAHRNAGFRKNPFGRVHLRGVIKSGTLGNAIFTLPVGYRPPKDMTVLVPAGVDMGVLVINATTGAVYINNYVGGSNAYVYLDGVEFDTDLVTTFLSGPKGDPGDASALYTMDTWHNLTLGSGITAYSSDTPQYMKDPFGVVRLRGQASMTAGTNVVIGTLPTGYRPTRVNRFAAMNGAGSVMGSVQVNTNGDVVLAATITGNVITLDEIEFDTGTVATFAAGPKGDTGNTGPAGPTGPPGTAVAPAQIAWQELPIDGAVWQPHPTLGESEPAWMLTNDGLVVMRGLIQAKTGATGLSFTGPSQLMYPFTSPEGSRVNIPGVNQTQEEVGFWEVLGSALVWHGPVANDDIFGLDGIMYPSIIGGALGVETTVTMGSGWTSDPTDPLRVWKTADEIRWMGTIQGTAPAAATTIFTVGGLSVHSRSVFGSAVVTTLSGPQHPDISGVDEGNFAVSTAGAVFFDSDYLGSNVMKIKMMGLYTKAEPE